MTFPWLAVFLSLNFVFCFWQKSYFKSLSGLVWRKLCAGSEFPVISEHHSHSWGVTGVQGTNSFQLCCSFFKNRDLQESKSSFCLMFAFMQVFLQLFVALPACPVIFHCEEKRNPYKIFHCSKAGAAIVLEVMAVSAAISSVVSAGFSQKWVIHIFH